MAGDGYTSRFVTGLAEHLAAADVGTWRTSGSYTANETGIVVRAIPQSPDRILTLAMYPIGSISPGTADHDAAVQIRCRGAGPDPRDCDDLADAVYDELDGLKGVTFGDIPVIRMWRQSYTSLGQDSNQRWARSENYYLLTMRPTRHNTD